MKAANQSEYTKKSYLSSVISTYLVCIMTGTYFKIKNVTITAILSMIHSILKCEVCYILTMGLNSALRQWNYHLILIKTSVLSHSGNSKYGT